MIKSHLLLYPIIQLFKRKFYLFVLQNHQSLCRSCTVTLSASKLPYAYNPQETKKQDTQSLGCPYGYQNQTHANEKLINGEQDIKVDPMLYLPWLTNSCWSCWSSKNPWSPTFSSPSEQDQHGNIQHFRNIHAKQTNLQLEQYTSSIENRIKCL